MAFNVSLTSYGSDGTEIDDSSIRMADDMDRQKAPYIEPDKTPHPPDEKPLDISTEAQEARIVVAERVGSPQNRPMLFHKWEPRLEDPVRSEPTQWFLAADFVAAADGTDQNLIGTTDDLLGSYWKPMILTPTQFLSSQTTRWSKSPDGWIVVHEDEHVSRISRVEGKALIKQCLAVGGVPVDLAADWTAKYPDKWPLTNWVGDYLHVLFSGRGPYSAVATTMDSESLRLWADLGASALKLLRQGETLRLEDQRQAAKDQINRLVYWFHALDDGDAEPTQLLPNGIAGGTLSLKVSEKPVILGWNSSQGVDSIKTPLDAAMLGRSLASGSHYFQIPAATFQRWDRFRIGVHRDYNLKFSIMPGNVPMTITLGESLFDPASPILDKLPPPIGTEVEKARLAELAKPIKPDGKDVIPP